jgi:hypothetical protein
MPSSSASSAPGASSPACSADARSASGSRAARGERNEALDTTIDAMAAPHGLIAMGLRLNAEADATGAAAPKRLPTRATPAELPQVIRSRWMR